MADRLRLGLIFGGRSVEHEVSVVSAQHVIAAADPERFEVVPIGVTKSGVWLSPSQTQDALDRPDAPFKKALVAEGTGVAALSQGLAALGQVDVVFPLVHGTHGEDGSLQGLLELADLPYVGCGVAASAVGMDKALMKAVFQADGLPVADYVVALAVTDPGEALMLATEVEDELDYPIFVKPANGGSSLGITRATSREELVNGITEASRFDRKLVIETGISGREVECAILGNADAEASPVGEIRYNRAFYDFEAKYLDDSTRVIVPADLPPGAVEAVQELALAAFSAIDGAGMSRIDCFLKPDGSLVIDEINTIPGFTPASMFPRLWQVAGLSYGALITRLVDLALARHREKRIA